MNDKKTLRKEILTQMKQQPKLVKDNYDQDIYTQLFSHKHFQSANSVALVLSMKHEVNTRPIIDVLLKNHKKVFVPSTNYETKQMKFQLLQDLESIDVDEKGIQFVNQETEYSDEIDLIIVPGVVFNEEGYRIGYGGGYYDKYLSQYNGHTISLAYPFQLNTFIPESHDFAVQEIIIPSEINGEE